MRCQYHQEGSDIEERKRGLLRVAPAKGKYVKELRSDIIVDLFYCFLASTTSYIVIEEENQAGYVGIDSETHLFIYCSRLLKKPLL